MSDVDLLPGVLRALNRMDEEIALPYPAIIEAVDVLEARGVLLLGWEPLATYPDGGFGAYPAPVIGGLSGIDVPAADVDWSSPVIASAALHRSTIEHEWRTRESTPPQEGVELIFCLTLRMPPEDARRSNPP